MMKLKLDLDKIRRLRQQRGLTMEAAAKLAGMHGRQQWYDIEAGRKGDIKLATLGSLCRALGCEPQDLLRK